MKVPAFSDIGKESKDLLYGSRTSGVFQYDQTLAVNAKTSHAVDFALKSMKRDGLLTMETKANIKKGPMAFEILAHKPKVTASFSTPLLEGLKMTLAASVPDIDTSGKLTLDYAHPYFTGKASCSLNTAPKLDVSAAVGHNGFVLGADTSVDVAKSAVLKWSAAATFIGTEFIVSAHLLDTETWKGTYHQKVDAASSIGAEIVQKIGSNKISILLGYSNTALNGDIRKFNISNDGTAQALYEFKPRPELTTALSLQVNTIDMSAPRMGFALEYTP